MCSLGVLFLNLFVYNSVVCCLAMHDSKCVKIIGQTKKPHTNEFMRNTYMYFICDNRIPVLGFDHDDYFSCTVLAFDHDDHLSFSSTTRAALSTCQCRQIRKKGQGEGENVKDTIV